MSLPADENPLLSLIKEQIEENLDYLFCDQVKNIKFELSLPFEDISFETIEENIVLNYKSNDTDIEDMSDIIQMLNMYICEMLKKVDPHQKENRKVIIPIYNKLLAKKLANKKYREGADKCKYPDEQPREYFNSDECGFQYNELVKYIWKPSVTEIADYVKAASE